MYRSPGSPPVIASPTPRKLTTSPSLIPAGIAILISSSRLIVPRPPHVSHFSFGIFPVPWQVSHVRTDEKEPIMERFTSCTLPFPLQVAHVSKVVPSFAPLPPQV